MKRSDRLLVLVTNNELGSFKRRIAVQACPGWERLVEIRSLEARMSIKKGNLKRRVDECTVQVIDDWGNGLFSSAVILGSVPIDVDRLKAAGIKVRETNSIDVTSNEVSHFLKDQKLHWQTHSELEWGSSSIKGSSPDAWRKQFSDLGCKWLGENISKIIRVVTEDELRQNFFKKDSVGLKVAHAFFDDDEPGSSSISIENILTHLYDEKSVFKLGKDCSLQEILCGGVNVLYLYEDGLWSGVELVKRLNALKANNDLNGLGVQIHFCYGVTSDVGLYAGRTLTVREKLANVYIPAAPGDYHYGFLGEGLHTSLEGNQIDDTKVRTALDENISPLAFNAGDIWVDISGKDKSEEARHICSEIGEQLIEQYWNDIGKSFQKDDIKKWALGALNFGSTIVFASSVPKPVLPLLWLGGSVSINGRCIEWKPLFADIRRTKI